MIQIVSAAFIKVENDKLKVLLTQRGPDTTYPLHWCTPGGKANDGESHQEALARELREELGLKYCPGITSKTQLYRHIGTRTNGQPFELFCYWMHFHGEALTPNHAQHCIDARWFAADELDGLVLTPADKEHIEQIKALLNGTSEDGEAKEELFQEALSGANALFDRRIGMRRLIARNENSHVSDIDGRPRGTRHELILDGARVLVREVWYWPDTGEEDHADEVSIQLNSLVHLVVNMTPAERFHFFYHRTCAPRLDWEGVRPNIVVRAWKRLISWLLGEGGMSHEELLARIEADVIALREDERK